MSNSSSNLYLLKYHITPNDSAIIALFYYYIADTNKKDNNNELNQNLNNN